MEKSKFAKKCKKDGGFFKCCVSRWRLHGFEKLRNILIKEKLINDKMTNICDPKSRKDRCLYCRTTGICTKQNSWNGTITHTYYPKMKKSAKRKLKLLSTTIINTKKASPFWELKMYLFDTWIGG